MASTFFMADHQCCWCGRDAPIYITNHHYYSAPMPAPPPPQPNRPPRVVGHNFHRPPQSNVTNGLVNALQNLGMYMENNVVQSVVGGGGGGRHVPLHHQNYVPDVSNWVPSDANSLREVMGDQFADMVQNNPDIRVFFEVDPVSSWSTDHGQPSHLSPVEVNQLRHYTVADATEPTPCVICHCAMEAQDIAIELPCQHTFHQECVSHWLLTQSNTCPLCRAEVSVEMSLSDSGTPEPPLSP